jgi:hypothetical protein
MAHDPGIPIIITDGNWMHIRHTRIYHRHVPEIRGEGASYADAAAHLANQLARALDFAHGYGGCEVIERALADLRAPRPARSGQPAPMP